MSATDKANTAGLYLLMKRGLYYRPDAMGYTGIKEHAGRYTREVAESHADPVSGVTMIREDEAEDFAAACFDDLARDHLQKKLDAALVTAASAEARIAELEAALAAAQTADAENDAHLRSRAQAAEARADRLGDSNGGLTLLPTIAELMNERD